MSKLSSKHSGLGVFSRQRHSGLHAALSVPFCIMLVALCGSLSGCGGGGAAASSTPTTPTTPVVTPTTPPTNMSGNWSLTAKETTGNGNGPLTTLNGSIAEQTATTPSDYVTAVLQASSGCFGNTAVVPLSGSVTQLQFQVTSFGINAQFLSLNTTKNVDATTMTGTYTIDGGCSNGQKGTITGTRYTPLTGSFSGSTAATSPQTVAVTVSQNGSGTGVGTTALSGTAAFTGISCFTTGTIGSAAAISGPNFTIPITTNEGTAGSQVLLTGTIDSGANTMTVTGAQIVTGACAGSLGSIALTRAGS